MNNFLKIQESANRIDGSLIYDTMQTFITAFNSDIHSTKLKIKMTNSNTAKTRTVEAKNLSKRLCGSTLAWKDSNNVIFSTSAEKC